ncbi:MAG: hypothetical protein IJ530_09220 [Treponema sp.]|uniref:hypothetical protein n=1 Tax=Treponema sp. TaxID=166 RepID=UPI0025D88164|nr:hypothetical protein [Treponema sp.]MBQ8679935.1 hypothetical protein [Treponema sp.]
MRKTLRLLVFSLIFLLFLSCENSFEEMLMRTTADPFQEVPTADSFSKENTVYLNWSADEGADEYILLRAFDSLNPSFSEIYRGKGLSYTDTGVEESYLYLYRLDKTRGGKYFKGKNYAHAVGAQLRKDAYEDNDSESKATFLESDIEANISCIRFSDGYELFDKDWYYIVIPARHTAEIMITQVGLSANDTTDFNVLIPSYNYEIKNPVNAAENPINNTELSSKVIRFKIYANETTVFTNVIGDKKVNYLNYTVSLTKIYQYSGH